MGKFWAAAFAAACCAVCSGAASAAVFVTASDNRAVVVSWDGSQDAMVAPANFQFGHYAQVSGNNAVGPGGSSLTAVRAFIDAASAPVLRLHPDLGDSGADGSLATSAIRLPEPATWAMILVGLSMIGLATRRRGNVDLPYD